MTGQTMITQPVMLLLMVLLLFLISLGISASKNRIRQRFPHVETVIEYIEPSALHKPAPVLLRQVGSAD